MGKVGKSVSKGFKKVTKAVVKTPVKQISKEAVRVTKKVTKAVITTPVKQIEDEVKRIPENVSNIAKDVGEFVAPVIGVGGSSEEPTVIQQTADKAKQRYSSEEGQATEQGATDLKTRLGVSDRKKIKRLSTVNKK